MKYKALVFVILAYMAAIPPLSAGEVIHIRVNGGIGPGVAEYIAGGVKYSDEHRASALLIELNTPGGLLESTRDIVHSILDSRTPVIVYVSPSGSRAGSAGVFITLAANIAAMAPGTNIGAAHPVGLGGQSDSSAMTDKITNDAAAFMRTIAQKRGRNIAWADSAVRQSISATENEALQNHAVDLIAPNIDSLLRAVDGMAVRTTSGEKILRTANAKITFIDKNWKQELLTFLSDPNIAYIFVMLAIYGIMFELYNPGSIFPGVIGGISAIIAGYSLQMLPINYAGLALIFLAIVLFIIEIKVTSYGMLTLGGIISLLLGSVMLIDSPYEIMSISMSIIITSVILTTVFFATVVGLGLKAQTRKRLLGSEAIIGATAVALTDIRPGSKGTVKFRGETWFATADNDIPAGSQVEITSLKGFTLNVAISKQKK